MRLLVLGGGAQGSAAAYDLLQDDGVEAVVVGDLQTDHVAPFLRPHLGGRLEVVAVDAGDEESARNAMHGMDGVVCALPYYFNHSMSRLAIEAGAHFADLGGNTGIVEEQRTLDGAARARGVSVIPDCGLAPGMVNILAQAGIDELDETVSVRMWVGGLPQDPEPPLNYQIVYSLEGVLDYYTTPGLILREGEPREVEPLTGLEEVVFPAPLGVLEAFYTAGGVSTLPHRYRGQIQTVEYKTLRYPGHATLMRGIRDLGLLDTSPVQVDGVEITPRQFFIDRVTPRLKRPGSPDLAVLRVEVRGHRGGGRAGVRFDLMDRFDPETGISAMMRVTGFSLALTALMQCRGEVRELGVRTPDEAVDPAIYMGGMAQRGIQIRRTELGEEGP
ncbi:MAG: saccharopine dehydrogenase [Gemmatimonadales bacterium]|nr:MAG: saccharopine dehydrogenase [Gemmatimonadales bacterium]